MFVCDIFSFVQADAPPESIESDLKALLLKLPLTGLDPCTTWLLGWSWNLDRLQVSPFSERLVCLALAASKGINLYKLQKAVERFAAEIVWSAGCIFPSRGRAIRLSQASFELC